MAVNGLFAYCIFLIFCVTNASCSSVKQRSDKCPDGCTCARTQDTVDVICSGGGLNDWSLMKLISQIPKDCTSILIEAPRKNPNNFSLTQDFVRFTKLRRLHLINCGLSSLGKRTFENIKSLKVLNLSENKIDYVSPDTFANTEHLEHLILSRNLLSKKGQKLPTGTFAYLRNLISLDLSQNFISDFSTNLFAGLDNLRVLNLSENKLTPSNFDLFYDLPKLETLNLADCQLSELPENGFRKNEALKNLNLNKNLLNSIVIESLKDTPNLESLSVANNVITFVPKFALESTSKLKFLDLSGNFLGISVADTSKLFTVFHPNAFKNMKIEQLNLANNSFAYFDSAILNLNSLKSLDLSHNPLGYIAVEQTRNLPNLRTLRLSDTNLKYVPSHPPSEYANLSTLDLSNNSIKSFNFETLEFMKSMKSLDISSNQFTQLSDYLLKFIESLQFVNLHSNPWDCQCHIVGLKEFLLDEKMRSLCGVMKYKDILCVTPKELTGKPVVLLDQVRGCATTYGASGLSKPSELGLVIAGICGLLLLLGLVAAVACSYFWPRATYHTNEEKANLSSSSSEHSNLQPTVVVKTVERLF